MFPLYAAFGGMSNFSVPFAPGLTNSPVGSIACHASDVGLKSTLGSAALLFGITFISPFLSISPATYVAGLIPWTKSAIPHSRPSWRQFRGPLPPRQYEVLDVSPGALLSTRARMPQSHLSSCHRGPGHIQDRNLPPQRGRCTAPRQPIQQL